MPNLPLHEENKSIQFFGHILMDIKLEFCLPKTKCLLGVTLYLLQQISHASLPWHEIKIERSRLQVSLSRFIIG